MHTAQIRCRESVVASVSEKVVLTSLLSLLSLLFCIR